MVGTLLRSSREAINRRTTVSAGPDGSIFSEVCLMCGRGIHQTWGLSLLICVGIMQIAHAGTQAISFVGQTTDQTDFDALGFGQFGFYFPRFAASSPVTQRPTDENMRFSMPGWLGFQFDITQPDRTFSGDAGLFDLGPPLVFGVYSAGGDTSWNTFRLPALAGAETGLSGSVVDEATENNSNNTVNRIQLGAGVPSSFLMRIVVDNTNGAHNPAGRLRARGDSINGGVDVGVELNNLIFNGIADVYTFRYDEFEEGDFIKIQLNSGEPGRYAGFAGLMFDPVPEPSSVIFMTVAAISCGAMLRRRFS
jgi:hypothetical protein